MREEKEDGEEIDFSSYPLPAYFYVELLQIIPITAHPGNKRLVLLVRNKDEGWGKIRNGITGKERE